ncbi:MAG: hypothetical protein HFE66_06485 [Clostridiales bacterium]|jgi:electron transport complex protein RnfA|nr:hypothetical protein [Clostridiales bacterium]
MEYVLLLLSAIFTDNFVFTRFLGIEQSFISSEKPSSAVKSGGLVTVVSLVGGGLTYLLYIFALSPLKISFLTLPIGVLLTTAVVAGVEVAAKNSTFKETLRGQIPMLTTNAVIMGAVFLAIEQNLNIGSAFLLFLGAGIGYTLAALVFASIRERLSHCTPPAAFAGIPIMITAAALAVMAFSGFAGLHF